MADTVRGITIEVAADGTKFKKAMTELQGIAKASSAELNTLQKSLKIKFDSETFAKAQKVAQQAIDDTARVADRLRERLQHLEKEGKVETKEYAELRKKLADAEMQAIKLREKLEEINKMRFDAIGQQFKKVGDGIQKAGQALTPFSVAAGAAITSLGALGTKAISSADDIATLATKYDMSATALQRFNYVALQTDTSSEDLYKAFVRVRSSVADIATGATSSATEALRKLNIDINSFGGSEEQFYGIIKTLADMEDKTQMVAIANDIFGDKLANNLLPMIYAGSDAIDQYAGEYANLGALSDEQVAKLAEFDNVMNEIKIQLANSALQIGSSLLPIMQRVASYVSENIVPKLQQLADWFNKLTVGQQEFALKALVVVAALAPLTIGVGKLVSAVGGIIKNIPKLLEGLNYLAAHPIILIIAAVVALLILLYTKCEAFREAVNNLLSVIGEALQPILGAIMGLLQNVMSVLEPIINMIGGILADAINIIVMLLQPLTAILQEVFAIVMPIFDILTGIINLVIAPLLIKLEVMFEMLKAVINFALIPLRVTLTLLQVPLQILGKLLGWLGGLFAEFANFVSGIFQFVVGIINWVLDKVETAINWCIDKINSLIDGINAMGGWLGISIDHLQKVSLQLDTSSLDGVGDVTATINGDAPDTTLNPYDTYEAVGAGGTTGDIINNDYSNNTKTQNVTVVIQNYAEEVDVDNLVRQINIKLAEAM